MSEMVRAVPYSCRVDRVDRWLNAQRGWRRALIFWLYFAPWFVDLGLLWSAWGNLDDQGTVPTGSVLVHVAIAAVVGIPLAAVQVRVQLWVRKRRPRAPVLSWRIIAAIYVFAGCACAQSYGMTRTLVWQHQHLSFKALLLSYAVAGALLIWNAVYCRKLRRQVEADTLDVAN